MSSFEKTKQLAEQGYRNAQYILGAMYYYGDCVEKSDDEAVRWYKKAAEQGHYYAQLNLDELTELTKKMEIKK